MEEKFYTSSKFFIGLLVFAVIFGVINALTNGAVYDWTKVALPLAMMILLFARIILSGQNAKKTKKLFYDVKNADPYQIAYFESQLKSVYVNGWALTVIWVVMATLRSLPDYISALDEFKIHFAINQFELLLLDYKTIVIGFYGYFIVHFLACIIDDKLAMKQYQKAMSRTPFDVVERYNLKGRY